jgi:hypothetical protein
VTGAVACAACGTGHPHGARFCANGGHSEAVELRSRAAETASEIDGLIQDTDSRAAFLRSRALVAG